MGRDWAAGVQDLPASSLNLAWWSVHAGATAVKELVGARLGWLMHVGFGGEGVAEWAWVGRCIRKFT